MINAELMEQTQQFLNLTVPVTRVWMPSASTYRS